MKLSIDIYILIMSVKQFAEFQFIIVKRSCSRPRRQKPHPLFSYLFYKSTMFCWCCECTQIKVDPLQFWMMYYSYICEQNWRCILVVSTVRKKCKWWHWRLHVLQSTLQLQLSAQTIGYACNSVHLSRLNI